MTTESPKTVIVTGASGFIAGNLIPRLLEDRYRVFGVDILPAPFTHHNYTHYQLDLVSQDPRELFGLVGNVDYIIHLAARTDLHGMRLIDYKPNTDGVFTICRLALLMNNVRVSFASSQLVNAVGDIAISVDDYAPDSIYGISKTIGEYIVGSILAESRVSYVIFRPTTVWGPGMSSHYQAFLRLLQKRLYFHPSLKAVKSFAFIDNAVSQILALTFNRDISPSPIVYVCDDIPVDVSRWCDDLAAAMGVMAPLKLPYLLCKFVAIANELGSLAFGRSRPFIPLTSRRLRNITTSYSFCSSVPLERYSKPFVSYDNAVRKTAQWFLALSDDL
ncbi:NAD(P)-dependent oxidoreductase [Synechococcus sp. UW140]|uniref:NAD-dependent epimerase/dehydratase family protein n=1 Tax=Synechococcus sp. UW140 TaxID=368503 RepID=UPI003137A9E3